MVAVSLKTKKSCHDPISLDALHSIEPDLKTEADIGNAIADADLVILGTEWSDYRKLQPAAFTAAPKTKTIIDGRNVLDVDLWQAAGWKVIALGRNIQNA